MNSILRSRLPASLQEIAEICRQHQVQELSIFGSALRSDFTDSSDFDFLVSFLPGVRIGFMELSQTQIELEDLLGRKVDLVPKNGLKAVIRDEVLASSEAVYAV